MLKTEKGEVAFAGQSVKKKTLLALLLCSFIPLLILTLHAYVLQRLGPTAHGGIGTGFLILVTSVVTAAGSYVIWDLVTAVTRTAEIVASGQQPQGLEERGDEIGTLMASFARMSHYDAVTGLPNRALFRDHLTRALARADRDRRSVALMFLDIDRFKAINDTLGHDVGDRLLKTVAERLGNFLRKVDTVARLGGDEFAIILEGIGRAQEPATVAQKLLRSMARAVTLEGHEIFVGLSIGIAMYPNGGKDANTLIKNADTALYRAKEGGRNTFQFYRPEMNVQVFERLALESSLRGALDREAFRLYYQPQLDLDSGRIIGAEALLRWQHPERGLVAPAEFIPVAEESGLIIPIGEWVLRQACAQNKAWQAAGLPPLRVAVNLSARQFRQKTLADTVARVLSDTGADPQCLELELTESLLMENTQASSTTLAALKGMGLQISIDDFGTGYSSLGYLKRFPIDNLKIDRSFVSDVTTDPDDAAIVTAIIALAHSLRVKAIAEGVETTGQLDFLRARRCDKIQGHLFSQALSAEVFAQLLRNGWQLAVN